ncbi:MAG: FIST C-terminal domain-containing protein [Acidimicrobiales bacterium]|nr:FIST C-terminal domain-containing protein [Acidimicrobiales bacterium]
MPFAAALSQHPLPTHAIGEVVGQVLEDLGDAPDAVVMFVSGGFVGATEDLAATVRATLRPRALVGATAAAVMAGEREVEGCAAVTLFAYRAPAGGSDDLPRSVLLTAVRQDDTWQVSTDREVVGHRGTLVLLADPFSFPSEAFVDDVTSRSPDLTVVGGLASAASGPGGNRLVADGRVVAAGAVGLLLPEGVRVQTVVSQGCRPVGAPLVVTRAQGSMIEEIAGQAALDRLLAQADAATPEDRRRMARGLHLGVVTDERKLDFDRGDFLIRAVLGADHERRAVAVGTEVPVGSTVQFQVRDAETADEDLRHLLAGAEGAAALVFSCTGRGEGLFGEPHHDAGLVSDRVDGGPLAGMFCAGEIGPVGDRHGVHAMTASVVLFSDGA